MRTKITLNEGQEKIANEAVNWFKNSPEQTFQIAGCAGTGKSVLINAIIKRLHLKTEEILPMAYTGQATSVMRSKGVINACTCHSGLFNAIKTEMKDEYGRPIIDKQFNVPIMKWSFIPKDFSNTKIKLIILDEAWMVPESFRQYIEDTGIKTIAAGDPGQLPPVKANPGYLVNGEIHYLTQLMRQAEDSPLIYLASRARQGLPIECGTYGNTIVIFDDELNNDMLAQANIVLCGTNATREYINRKIRHDIRRCFTDFPMYGERIICRKNNWEKEIDGIALVNGLIGAVATPPSIDSYDGKTYSVDFLPDLLRTPFTGLKINRQYLNATYKEKELLKDNPYLMGERFEYAYASTVHLAQGSEYSFGIYLEEFMRRDMQNALNYTAITRFKQNMIYVKQKPKFWRS